MHTQLCTDIVLVFDIFKAKRQCKHPSRSPFGGEVTVAVGRLAMTLVYRYFHRFPPIFSCEATLDNTQNVPNSLPHSLHQLRNLIL